METAKTPMRRRIMNVASDRGLHFAYVPKGDADLI